MEINSNSASLESVSRIKLRNQAGAVTILKGYVKVSEISTEYYKCGATDNFSVGKERTINLNDHLGDKNNSNQTRENGYIYPGDYVTAYAAIDLHSDVYGSIWLEYDPNANRTAVFVLTGALWELNVAFEGFE